MSENQETLSYMVLKSDSEPSQEVQTLDLGILQPLVVKHNIIEASQDYEKENNVWQEISAEYESISKVSISADILKEKWLEFGHLHNYQGNQRQEVKFLEASIAKELGSNQHFRVEQIDEGDKTSTTIVLLNANAVEEQHQVQEQRSEKDTENLIELALTQSGIQDQAQEDEAEYEELANEILRADKDTRIVKKRLKWNKKIHVEESHFNKSKMQREMQIEMHKRDFADHNQDIWTLENTLHNKEKSLKKILSEIATLKSSIS